MILTEFACENSQAVSRIAFNPDKREIVCQYRSNGATYLYINVPSEVTEETIATAISKGKFMAYLKKKCPSRRVENFPRKVRMYKPRQHTAVSRDKKKRGPRFKDYSDMWIQMSQSVEACQRSHVDLMISVLLRCHLKYPPSKKPPRMSAQGEMSQPDDTSTLSNAFSALHMDDSISDDESKKGRDEGAPTDEEPAGPSVQTRYLHIKLICRYVECIRHEAEIAQRDKMYLNMQRLWEEAWNTLFDCQVSIDEWYAVLCAFSSPDDGASYGDVLPDRHDRAQLEELFAGLQLLVDDTERHKESTLKFLLKRRGFTLQKLYPMWNDRDKVKASIGEESWKNNPAPAQSYAERRRQWEEDLRVISAALASIQELDFCKILHG
jgi:hypothetical protein